MAPSLEGIRVLVVDDEAPARLRLTVLAGLQKQVQNWRATTHDPGFPVLPTLSGTRIEWAARDALPCYEGCVRGAYCSIDDYLITY
jgi:hypothetical protein